MSLDLQVTGVNVTKRGFGTTFLVNLGTFKAGAVQRFRRLMNEKSVLSTLPLAAMHVSKSSKSQWFCFETGITTPNCILQPFFEVQGKHSLLLEVNKTKRCCIARNLY
jgi:hypothetical protein